MRQTQKHKQFRTPHQNKESAKRKEVIDMYIVYRIVQLLEQKLIEWFIP